MKLRDDERMDLWDCSSLSVFKKTMRKKIFDLTSDFAGFGLFYLILCFCLRIFISLIYKIFINI